MSSTPDQFSARTSVDRRRFMRAAVASTPALYLLQPAGKVRSSSLTAAEVDPAPITPGMVIRQKQPENLEFPFSNLKDFITPNEQFYVRNHFPVPQIDPKTFQLNIEGAVDRPLKLSYDELLELSSHNKTAMLECAGNGRVFLVPQPKGAQWEMGAASNAEWTGVPLAALLKRAGVKKSAVDVVLEGADGGEIKDPPKPSGKVRFTRSIPIAKAMEDVLLATKMNGEPLPAAHGFPLRAVVPAWYAMASIKWLSRIIVTEQPYNGYYETVDYAYWQRSNGLETRVPITEMQVKAQIARPAVREVVPRDSYYRVHGAAWTGNSLVEKVEVSTDGGKTFSPAKLLGEAVPAAWRLWEFDWRTPSKAGQYTLMARATDARGQTQPAERDLDRENYMINHLLPIEVIVR